MNPKVLPNYFQERAGVLKVADLLNKAGIIFRETPNADVGIDGYIEQVDEGGAATGATVAVQIKSGPSYFRDGGENWLFYPKEKHESYWEMYPLPVLVMLHEPRTDAVYWTDVRLQLRSGKRSNSPLLIPKILLLSQTSPDDLFASAGSRGVGMMNLEECLRTMALTKSPDQSFPISYLDIFLEGLTDIGRKLFFSAGMCWDLAELALPEDSPSGVGMGGAGEDFLDLYLRFLVEQSLAHIDYSDILVDLIHREMYPTILVPLTSRGRDLRELCRKVGTVGSPLEITEVTIGLMNRVQAGYRSFANFAVARKISDHYGDA